MTDNEKALDYLIALYEMYSKPRGVFQRTIDAIWEVRQALQKPACEVDLDSLRKDNDKWKQGIVFSTEHINGYNQAIDDIKSLLGGPQDKWLPIDSAPEFTDEYYCLCYNPFYAPPNKKIVMDRPRNPDGSTYHMFSHWMPLPPPPQEQE